LGTSQIHCSKPNMVNWTAEARATLLAAVSQVVTLSKDDAAKVFAIFKESYPDATARAVRCVQPCKS
jgi:hypothetical protein